MDKIPAILESYDTSCRVTPERPLKKKGGNEFKKIKAEIFRWESSGAMDIFFLPPPNPLAASTKVVRRFDWGGSVTRSIYGNYRMSFSYTDRHGNPYKASEQQSHMREMMAWIAEDAKTFKPEHKTRTDNP